MIIELFRDSKRGVLALVTDDENPNEDPVLVMYDSDADPDTEPPAASIVVSTDDMVRIGGQILTQASRLERIQRTAESTEEDPSS